MCFGYSLVKDRENTRISPHAPPHPHYKRASNIPVIVSPPAPPKSTTLSSFPPAKSAARKEPLTLPYWEAPVLDYSHYTVWDKVQKENFLLGGPDLTWKTNVVDLRVEKNLLGEYWLWVDKQLEDTNNTKEERAFLEGLLEELHIDNVDVWEELGENDTRFGKTEDDHQVILDQARGIYLKEQAAEAGEK